MWARSGLSVVDGVDRVDRVDRARGVVLLALCTGAGRLDGSRDRMVYEPRYVRKRASRGGDYADRFFLDGLSLARSLTIYFLELVHYPSL